jgi:formylglycine-generating enzyme required for sulfatase activity
MKKVSILLMLLLSVTAFGQAKPQKVYSIVKERRELSWYQEQAKLWKAEIDKNNQNTEAWYYYYVATSAQVHVCKEEEENKNEIYDLKDKIIKDCYSAVPNSFEANFLMYKGYKGEGNGKSNFDYLKKAYEINPYDTRCYVDFLTHYAIVHDQVNYEKFCSKFYTANEIPSAIYNWAYNTLSELDENAIIFTAGDNDTYSLWMLQVVKSFRPDVYVVNTGLLTLDDYRDKLFEKIGLDPLVLKIFNSESNEEYLENQNKVYNHIFNNNKNIPVYVSSTAIFQFQEDYSDNLYLTGLAYKYSQKSIDNISLIRRNYEKRYLLDYLTQVFSFNVADNKANEINATYLPAFVKLYKHYLETEEVEKMNVLKKYIIDISKKSGQETEISELLGAENTAPNDFNTVLLSTKSIENQFVKIYDQVFMNKYEVSNIEYQRFLTDLLNSRNIELFKTCLYDSLSWTESYQSYADPMKNMYHWHPAYDNYPIVNISNFAATKYCEWLTIQYNSQNKRSYTKVIFRLPTEKEWEFAASNGEKTVNTPFENDNVKNEDCKCYLANLKYSSEDGGKFYDDGGFFMVKTDSYEPNQLGIYNMLGNVAEMIDQNNISKGGSWNSYLKDSYIPSKRNYSGVNPETGFRIVMDVIEE